MANELRLFQNYIAGRLLYALPLASTVVTDGATTNASTTVTSATAAFVASDVGAPISGTNIPAGAYIASITNGTTVVISAAATGTGSSISITISREKVIHSAGLSTLSTITTTQHQMVGLDPDGMAGAPEVVMVTKHDAAALWAQITRAQEGSAARAHAAGMDWTTSVFASDFASPALTREQVSPADVTPIAAGATATISDRPIVGAGRLGTLASIFFFTTIFGVTGTGSAAGTVNVQDAAPGAVIGEARWHTNSVERQMQVSAFAQLWVPTGTTITTRIAVTNDGGSGQSVQSRDNRLTISKVAF